MDVQDKTHDPARRAWLASAQAEGTEFPIQNLPHGVFSRGGEAPRGGVAIGDQVLDLRAALDAGLVSGAAAEAAAEPTLNRLMGMGRGAAREVRGAVSDLLSDEGRKGAVGAALVPMGEARMHLPAAPANFTDFMVSRDHTSRLVGRVNPTAPLPPCFDYLPVAYHSRASSVRVSGEDVIRPNGQWRRADGEVRFGPSESLDYELELAVWLAGSNALGEPVPMARAGERVFGYGLLNDWSARDMQGWEMVPLGPFLSKSLSTSVSPWVVTAEALVPFGIPATERGGNVPQPLPHLDSPANRERGGLSVAMEVHLVTAAMRASGVAPARLTATDFATMAWTPAQMVTHHASNGCNLLPGDLLGSGTCSGPTEESRACLAEILITGQVTLPNGEVRRFLEDGDQVIFTARAHAPGAVSIGFGECRATVLPAVPWPGA